VRFVSLLIVSLFLGFFAMSAHADVDGVYVWQPNPNGVRFLLPKIRNVALSELAQRYTNAVKSSPEYGRMIWARLVPDFSKPEGFSEMPQSTAEHPNVAVILNRPAQMLEGRSVLSETIRVFEKEGPRLFAVPIGLETVLNAEEMEQFRKFINTMDGQLGMGGDDVHPMAYGKSDVGRARGDLSAARDREIIAYFREYLKNGKGRVFYICGALQRAAILDGRALHDDIAHLTQGKHMNEDGLLSAVEVIAEEGSELAAAVGSTRFMTSNAHHSAVDPDSALSADQKPSFQITAYNIEPDGSRGRIVKALEFPGNAGFGTQFHPELSTFPEQKRIVQYVAQGWKLRGRVSPEEILRCLNRELKLRFSTN
jgi:gamma-glutamyl-gamma-aminobutyrate hydrolase PuuD